MALQRALYEAVQQGNVTRVREALARGAHVEATLAGARFATRLAPCLGWLHVSCPPAQPSTHPWGATSSTYFIAHRIRRIR